jgi:hypothetical protein
VNQINEKLEANSPMISNVDKGNSIVITYENEYSSNVAHLIDNSNCTNENNDLTNKFQKEIKNKTNQCQLIIPTDERWKYGLI